MLYPYRLIKRKNERVFLMKKQKRIKDRVVWGRKPQTQVVPNKKAVASKYACRG